MKITSRHMSTNGELILKVMLSGCKAFQDQNWSYSRDYDINECSVIIIDIDKAEGRQLWQTLDLSDSSLIKISYSATPENFPDNSYLLKKPIHFKELNRLTENLKVLDNQHSDKKWLVPISRGKSQNRKLGYQILCCSDA
jgi:hypothetical protein